jgi:hypothetical protein
MGASQELRGLVLERAGDRCEYCTLRQEDDDIFRFPIDRILSEQHGGNYTPENTALACHYCNRKKGPNIASVEPGTTGPVVPLFNPRKDRWDEHFKFQGAVLVGLTPTGRATVALLDMNNPKNVELRSKAGYPKPKPDHQ